MHSIIHLYDTFGRIKDSNLHNQFLEMNYHYTPINYLIFAASIYSFFILPMQIMTISMFNHDLSDDILSFIGLVAIVITCSILWTLVYMKTFHKNYYPWWIQYSLNGVIISACCYQIVRYAQLNLIESCSGLFNFPRSIICSSTQSNGVSLIMLSGPILITTMIRGKNFILNLIYYDVCVISLMIGYALRGQFHMIVVLLLFCFAGLIVLYDLQIQSVSMFLLNHKLQDTLDENEKNADRIHADEMRHMIANVAHDLKTPLTSFMTGMDLIAHIVSDCHEHLTNNTITKLTLHEAISAIELCIENVHNTNSFMLMTINRCIDYTKASNGMKLVPRYETINLLETLKLPLSCMKNIQNRIDIVLNTIPLEVCTHLITDLQWLQENILCLLSNAVKYSTEGKVSISVSIVDCILNMNDQEEEIVKEIVESTNVRTTRRSVRVLPVYEFEHYTIRSMKPKKGLDDVEGELEISAVSSHQASIASNLLTTHIRFEVEDTGIGMSDEAMASLFNPFKQTQRLAGGTGLGLYSLAKRVEALNGKYGVRRRRDGQKGSLFWFSFPYRPDEAFAQNYTSKENALQLPSIPVSNGKDDNHFESIPIKSTPTLDLYIDSHTPSSDDFNESSLLLKNPQRSSDNMVPKFIAPEMISNKIGSISTSSSLHILLVDDSPAILKMTSMILSKQGHFIYLADNGEEGMKQVQNRWEESKTTFDLVLMDLQMPIMDGLEATRRIRMLENLSLESNDPLERSRNHQIIIGLSANSDNETTEAALRAGVDDFLPKPFKIESFYHIARRLLTINGNKPF